MDLFKLKKVLVSKIHWCIIRIFLQLKEQSFLIGLFSIKNCKQIFFFTFNVICIENKDSMLCLHQVFEYSRKPSLLDIKTAKFFLQLCDPLYLPLKSFIVTLVK